MNSRLKYGCCHWIQLIRDRGQPKSDRFKRNIEPPPDIGSRIVGLLPMSASNLVVSLMSNGREGSGVPVRICSEVPTGPACSLYCSCSCYRVDTWLSCRNPEHPQKPVMIFLLIGKVLVELFFIAFQAGRSDPRIAALDAVNGRRAHQTCSRFGGGCCPVEFSLRDSTPISLIGSHSSISRFWFTALPSFGLLRYVAASRCPRCVRRRMWLIPYSPLFFTLPHAGHEGP